MRNPDIDRFILHPLLHAGERTAAGFLEKIEASLERNPLPHVVSIMGLPGSGKTHFRKLINREFAAYSPENLIWGIHGEDAARDKGFITSPKRNPYTENELLASAAELERATVESLSKNRLTLVEYPGITAIKMGEDKLGREQGYQLLSHLARRELSVKDYIAYYIVVTSGDTVRFQMVNYREELQLIGENLPRAREIARKYNKPEPVSIEDIERAKQGAPLALIEITESRLLEAIEELRVKYGLAFSRRDRLVIGAYAQYLLQENLGIPTEKFYIAFNDPSPT